MPWPKGMLSFGKPKTHAEVWKEIWTDLEAGFNSVFPGLSTKTRAKPPVSTVH